MDEYNRDSHSEWQKSLRRNLGTVWIDNDIILVEGLKNGYYLTIAFLYDKDLFKKKID